MHALPMAETFPHTFGNERTERSEQRRQSRQHAIERGIKRDLARLSGIAAIDAGPAPPDIPVVERVEEWWKELRGLVYGVAIQAFRRSLNNEFGLGKYESIEFIECISVVPWKVLRRNAIHLGIQSEERQRVPQWQKDRPRDCLDAVIAKAEIFRLNGGRRQQIHP